MRSPRAASFGVADGDQKWRVVNETVYYIRLVSSRRRPGTLPGLDNGAKNAKPTASAGQRVPLPIRYIYAVNLRTPVATKRRLLFGVPCGQTRPNTSSTVNSTTESFCVLSYLTNPSNSASVFRSRTVYVVDARPAISSRCRVRTRDVI